MRDIIELVGVGFQGLKINVGFYRVRTVCWMVRGFAASIQARRLRATVESANTAPSKDNFLGELSGFQVFMLIRLELWVEVGFSGSVGFWVRRRLSIRGLSCQPFKLLKDSDLNRV